MLDRSSLAHSSRRPPTLVVDALWSRRGAARETSRSTLLDPMAPGKLKKEKKEQKEQPGDMGQGTMTGSHTPWAQGPANSIEIQSKFNRN